MDGGERSGSQKSLEVIESKVVRRFCAAVIDKCCSYMVFKMIRHGVAVHLKLVAGPGQCLPWGPLFMTRRASPS